MIVPSAPMKSSHSGFDTPCQPAADCHPFVLDTTGVVFCDGRQEVYAFNTSATWIWMAMEDGLSATAIADELAELLDGPREQAEEMVRSVLDEWWTLGLLASSEQNRPVLTRPPVRTLPRLVLQLDERPRHGERNYRLRHTRFTIVYGNAEEEALVHPILSHLEEEGPAPYATELRLIQTKPGYAVLRDGALEEYCESLSGLGPSVKCCMMRIALNDHPYRFQIHGGVVARNGRCVVLPAESGSGKTCLVAGLVRDGWQYLSDECAPFEGTDLRLHPIPIAMATKEGAWPVLCPSYPELAETAAHLREDGKLVRYLLPPPNSVAPDRSDGYRARWIVFPSYGPTAKTELQPLPRIEVLQRLFAQCLSLPGRLDEKAVSQIVGWIRTIDGYLLPNSNLNEAVQLINALEG